MFMSALCHRVTHACETWTFRQRKYCLVKWWLHISMSVDILRGDKILLCWTSWNIPRYAYTKEHWLNVEWPFSYAIRSFCLFRFVVAFHASKQHVICCLTNALHVTFVPYIGRMRLFLQTKPFILFSLSSTWLVGSFQFEKKKLLRETLCYLIIPFFEHLRKRSRRLIRDC